MLKGSCKKISTLVVMSALCATFVPVSSLSAESADVNNYYTRIPSQREKALLSARDFAYEYLNNSHEEPLWKDKSPYISSEKFFYTANDEIPSYIEFKVSTDENDDAGFIIVNLDENDVRVPLASPSGKTPSEALKNRLANNEGNQTGNKKLYYFSPFDQWLINEKTGNAETLNPNNQEDEIKKDRESISTRSTEDTKTILTEEGKQKQNAKFAQMKQNAKEFVKSAEFRERKGIYERSKEGWGYKEPSAPPNKFVRGAISRDQCTSIIPCYNQFQTGWFNFCSSGCGPTALMMIMGYYDRNAHYFPDQPGLSHLFPGKAPAINNDKVIEIIKSMRSKIGTTCGGSSYFESLDKGLDYFREKGFIITGHAGVGYDEEGFAEIIAQSINQSHPVLLQISYRGTDVNKNGHYIVAYGYYKRNPLIIRVNMGWGPTHQYGDYNTASLDYNLKSIFYGTSYGQVNAYLVPIITKTP